MKARICVEGELLEEIEVENGLWQGCTMAPTWCNLYACVVAESCLLRMLDVDGVGTYLLYKPDQWLFRWYTKNACEDTLYKCEFVNDVTLLATTHAAADTAIQTYNSEAEMFGLTVNVSKTKFLTMGHEVQDLKMLPMTVDDASIECVKEFQPWGLL